MATQLELLDEMYVLTSRTKRILGGSTVTKEYIRSVVEGLENGGKKLAQIALSNSGACGVGYMLECMQYYNNPVNGIEGLSIVQEFLKMIQLLDEAGMENVEYQDMNGLIVTASDLVFSKPRVTPDIYERAAGNLAIISYKLQTRLGYKGLVSPCKRGIRFSYGICKITPATASRTESSSSDENVRLTTSGSNSSSKSWKVNMLSKLSDSCIVAGYACLFRKSNRVDADI